MTIDTEKFTGHTPGPWDCRPAMGGWGLYTVLEAKKALSASHNSPEDSANADLIASAPDLLAEVAMLRDDNAKLMQALEWLYSAASVQHDREYAAVTNAAAVLAQTRRLVSGTFTARAEPQA